MKIKKKKKVGLFLDVGFAHCGAVVSEFPTAKILRAICCTTEKRSKESTAQGNLRRCREIATLTHNLTKDYKVDFLCGELPHGGAQSARAMSQMSMATAVVATLSAITCLPFHAVTPREVKLLVNGKGKATKEEIQAFVEKKIQIVLPARKDIREHIADAAACIVVLQNRKIQR